jgi:hypothetical protein
VIASLLDQATSLADRATSYPFAVKAFFIVTFVVVLISVFVYALLYPTAVPDAEQPPATKQPTS